MKIVVKGNIWDYLSRGAYDKEEWTPSQDQILLAMGKVSSYPWDEMAIKFDRSPSECFGRYQELVKETAYASPEEEQESIEEEEEKEDIPPPSYEPTMSTSKRTSAIESMERLKRRRMSRSQSESGDRLAPAVASSSPCSKAVQPSVQTIDITDGINLNFDEKFGSPADDMAFLWPEVTKLALPTYSPILEGKSPTQFLANGAKMAFHTLHTMLHTQQHFDTFEGRINSLEGKVTKLEDEKGNLSARLKVAEDKARQLEVQAQLRVEKDQVARLQEAFNGVSDKLTTFEGKINSLEGKVTKLEAEKGNMSARLKVIEDKVRQLVEVQSQLRVENDQVAHVQEAFNGVSDKLNCEQCGFV